MNFFGGFFSRGFGSEELGFEPVEFFRVRRDESVF